MIRTYLEPFLSLSYESNKLAGEIKQQGGCLAFWRMTGYHDGNVATPEDWRFWMRRMMCTYINDSQLDHIWRKGDVSKWRSWLWPRATSKPHEKSKIHLDMKHGTRQRRPSLVLPLEPFEQWIDKIGLEILVCGITALTRVWSNVI